MAMIYTQSHTWKSYKHPPFLMSAKDSLQNTQQDTKSTKKINNSTVQPLENYLW